MESGWQLSGSGPEAYEDYIVVAWMGNWAESLVALLDMEPAHRVLDVGCGTGVVTREAARRIGSSGRIVGIDINEVMLETAQHLAGKAGHDAIEWRQGDVTSMPFDAAEFDVILCEQGLQYFPDRTSALVEMARVLGPGGHLALSVWRSLERQPFFVALIDCLETYLDAGSTESLKLAFSLNGREEVRSLCANAGFRDVHVRHEVKMSRFPSLKDLVPGFIAASPVAGDVAAMTDSARDRLFRDIVEALDEFCDDDGFAAPMECHVVTARK